MSIAAFRCSDAHQCYPVLPSESHQCSQALSSVPEDAKRHNIAHRLRQLRSESIRHREVEADIMGTGAGQGHTHDLESIKQRIDREILGVERKSKPAYTLDIRS